MVLCVASAVSAVLSAVDAGMAGSVAASALSEAAAFAEAALSLPFVFDSATVLAAALLFTTLLFAAAFALLSPAPQAAMPSTPSAQSSSQSFRLISPLPPVCFIPPRHRSRSTECCPDAASRCPVA